VIIDTNVYLSRWPFRRLPGDDPAKLVAKLRSKGVGQAWAGSFDGLLFKDVAGVNDRLAKDCRGYGRDLLVPFGSLNPKLPDWRDDVRRCQEVHRMPGIRLHPNYHGYDLKDPDFVELLRLATARGLIVQIALCMEDVRTQHPLVRVPPVDIAPFSEAISRAPGVRIVMLNCTGLVRLDQLQPALSAGNVYMDISMVEGVGGIARLLEDVPPEKVVFGSYYPFFYFESAFFKMQEAGLADTERTALFAGNARKLLAAAPSASPAQASPA
jgi:predicted TIM-barrel fold metal-dependent hydrolase